jgi:TIR domain
MHTMTSEITCKATKHQEIVVNSETIFISYAREDSEIALRLYSDLLKSGYTPWIDQKSIVPGKNWKDEVSATIWDSRYFILLLSSNSVGKRGYCQKEVKVAMEAFDDFPSGDVFIIPVRLDNCDVREERIRKLQRVDLFPSYQAGLEIILSALRNDASVLEKSGEKTLALLLEGKETDYEIKEAIRKYAMEKSSRELSKRESQLHAELLYLIQQKTAQKLIKSRRLIYLLGLLIAARVLKDISSAASSFASGASARSMNLDSPNNHPGAPVPTISPTRVPTVAGSANSSSAAHSGSTPTPRGPVIVGTDHAHGVISGKPNISDIHEYATNAISEHLAHSAANEVANQAVDHATQKAAEGLANRIFSGIVSLIVWLISSIFNS